ncbi:T-box transcription factor TBX21 [Hoplias malabaricus]|uniref:T-box transcription factor TBX21 n=1 Tax=Hoplias malabaricus TaxID=27720 RepID=UPI0034627761
MGGIGGNFQRNMLLNGADAHGFPKDADVNPAHRDKPPAEGHESESAPPLPFAAATEQGRFYAGAPLASCHFQSYGAGVDAYATYPEHPHHHHHHHHHHHPTPPHPPPPPPPHHHHPHHAAHLQHGYPRAPPLCALPGLQVCGKTQVVLNNFPLWAKFHKYQTEMIITKQGRRMFPFLSFNISSLDPSAHYNVYVDVVLADQHHWRYQGGKWVQCGKAEGNMPGNRMYMHPDSPNTGNHWMRQEVSFGKLKLTNNKGSSNNMAQMIVLQSLHKYQPRLHIVEVKEDGTEDPFLSSKAQTFIFPETQFIAVTAYQNADITQLKIDHNPFAKGFRDNYDTLYAPPDSDRLTPSPTDTQQLMAGSCYPHQPYLSDQYVNPLQHSRFYSREPVSMAHQGPKDPPAVPHARWYLPSQQGPPSNRLDFNSYESDYTSSSLYKPFPIQTSPHHPLSYYPDNPFASGPVSSASPGTWTTGRPSPQYLNHTHPGKPTSGLSWFHATPSSPSTVNSRLHPPASLLESLRLPLLQDKPKESGDDPWMETPSVKSVDSTDSGLFESGESKKRRVSPYASSTENSPPNRTNDNCEKDNSSDASYYSFYSH